MTSRTRWIVLAVVSAIVLIGAAGYGLSAFLRYQQVANTPSDATTVASFDDTPRIVFRNTALGTDYGLVASVPLDDPSAERMVVDVACDRVDASRQGAVCLKTNRGVLTTFSAIVFDSEWNARAEWGLPGIPSRARLSPDGSLVGTTSFVTGHSYATVGFSTETAIRGIDGSDHGNIETFDLVVDGAAIAPVDRNMWGVTFVDDDHFYATAASAAYGTTWLVEGSLSDRTLTALQKNAECPSISPDGTRIAYKKNTAAGATSYWTLAVLDLATGRETVLPEQRNVDDQVEWLDDDTLLYGLPRGDDASDTDVWSIAADGEEAPTLFLEHAWSPSIVR